MAHIEALSCILDVLFPSMVASYNEAKGNICTVASYELCART